MLPEIGEVNDPQEIAEKRKNRALQAQRQQQIQALPGLRCLRK
jgi:hypothetical protein